MTAEDAVAGIAATTTYTGLKVTAVLDEGDYPGGVKVSDEQVKHLEERVIAGTARTASGTTPRPAGPGPEPPAAPAPGPDLQGPAALAGVGDLGALLEAAAVPWAAAREQRLHLARGHSRRKASGGGPGTLPYEAIVTAAACHLRPGMPYRLLGELLAAHETTISLSARRVIPLLAEHGITPHEAGMRITTPARLREHAAARGITITGITTQTARENAYQDDDTPETAN